MTTKFNPPTPYAVIITHVRPSDIRGGFEYGDYCICGNPGEAGAYVFLNSGGNAIPATLRKVGQPGFINWDKEGRIHFVPATRNETFPT